MDIRYMEEDICFYGRNKIVMVVQRYNQKYQLVVQLKFDREGDGHYLYSRRMVQISPNDSLRELRNFANRMGEKYIEHGNCMELYNDTEGETEVPDFERL